MPLALIETNEQRAQFENLASIYSIVATLEMLEKAYVDDSISSDLYTEKCKQLLSTFKTASQVSSPPLDLPAFCAKYRLECPAAIHRIKMGVPATIEHGGDDSLAGKQSDAHVAMLATEAFITVLDSLKLDLTAADDLFPILSALLDKLNGVRSLGVDFVGKEKVREWLGKINGMRASDRLSEGDTRQLLFDIESSYLAFQNVLAKKS